MHPNLKILSLIIKLPYLSPFFNNYCLLKDDGSEKSVFVKKSTVLKSTTTKSSTKTATVPITNTSSINKSSSSINSTKTAPEKEPFTPTTAKLISKTARATRLNNLSTTKQKHSNNKENQQTSVPKSRKFYHLKVYLKSQNTLFNEQQIK